MWSVEQSTRRNTEGRRKFLDQRETGIAASALDIADIGAVDIGTIGIVLLAPASFEAKATNIAAEAKTDIHGQPMKPVSPINLQTISDICA